MLASICFPFSHFITHSCAVSQEDMKISWWRGMFSSLHLFLRAKKLIFCSTPSRPPAHLIDQDYITGPFQNPVQERTMDSYDWLRLIMICVLWWEGPRPMKRMAAWHLTQVKVLLPRKGVLLGGQPTASLTQHFSVFLFKSHLHSRAHWSSPVQMYFTSYFAAEAQRCWATRWRS